MKPSFKVPSEYDQNTFSRLIDDLYGRVGRLSKSLNDGISSLSEKLFKTIKDLDELKGKTSEEPSPEDYRGLLTPEWDTPAYRSFWKLVRLSIKHLSIPRLLGIRGIEWQWTVYTDTDFSQAKSEKTFPRKTSNWVWCEDLSLTTSYIARVRYIYGSPLRKGSDYCSPWSDPIEIQLTTPWSSWSGVVTDVYETTPKALLPSELSFTAHANPFKFVRRGNIVCEFQAPLQGAKWSDETDSEVLFKTEKVDGVWKQFFWNGSEWKECNSTNGHENEGWFVNTDIIGYEVKVFDVTDNEWKQSHYFTATHCALLSGNYNEAGNWKGKFRIWWLDAEHSYKFHIQAVGRGFKLGELWSGGPYPTTPVTIPERTQLSPPSFSYVQNSFEWSKGLMLVWGHCRVKVTIPEDEWDDVFLVVIRWGLTQTCLSGIKFVLLSQLKSDNWETEIGPLAANRSYYVMGRCIGFSDILGSPSTPAQIIPVTDFKVPYPSYRAYVVPLWTGLFRVHYRLKLELTGWNDTDDFDYEGTIIWIQVKRVGSQTWTTRAVRFADVASDVFHFPLLFNPPNVFKNGDPSGICVRLRTQTSFARKSSYAYPSNAYDSGGQVVFASQEEPENLLTVPTPSVEVGSYLGRILMVRALGNSPPTVMPNNITHFSVHARKIIGSNNGTYDDWNPDTRKLSRDRIGIIPAEMGTMNVPIRVPYFLPTTSDGDAPSGFGSWVACWNIGSNLSGGISVKVVAHHAVIGNDGKPTNDPELSSSRTASAKLVPAKTAITDETGFDLGNEAVPMKVIRTYGGDLIFAPSAEVKDNILVETGNWASNGFPLTVSVPGGLADDAFNVGDVLLICKPGETITRGVKYYCEVTQTSIGKLKDNMINCRWFGANKCDILNGDIVVKVGTTAGDRMYRYVWIDATEDCMKVVKTETSESGSSGSIQTTVEAKFGEKTTAPLIIGGTFKTSGYDNGTGLCIDNNGITAKYSGTTKLSFNNSTGTLSLYDGIITAGTIQTTSTTGRGVKITSNGIVGYNSSGSVTFALDANTGAVTIKGGTVSSPNTFEDTLYMKSGCDIWLHTKNYGTNPDPGALIFGVPGSGIHGYMYSNVINSQPYLDISAKHIIMRPSIDGEPSHGVGTVNIGYYDCRFSDVIINATSAITLRSANIYIQEGDVNVTSGTTNVGALKASVYKSADGTVGVTSSVSVRKGDDSGSITLCFKNGLYVGTT